MELKVHGVPEKLDEQVGRYTLDAMGIRIDEMTEEQKRYMHSS
jgi:adenosylhomocysteinase